MEPNTNPITNNKKEKLLSKSIIVVIILIVIASISLFYFYNKTVSLKQNQEKENEAKVAMLVEKVGKLIALPSTEKPAIAIISDMKPFANNPFFAKAQVGDYLIVYPVSKTAIIYNEKTNIVVEVATLNIGQ